MPVPHPTALVVGSGPTGLMLAGELARHGVACRLIDRRPGPATTSRALAVQARTTEIFSYLGMADDLIARGLKGRGMSPYWGKDRLAHLSMDELDSPFPFVLFLPQTETEAVLTDRLTRLGLAPEWSTELTSFAADADGVSVTLRRPDGSEEQLHVRYLLGCDGAHSPVRKGAGLSFQGETYSEAFACADVRLDWELPHDEVSVFPGPEGLTAAFPLPGEGRFRFMWMTETTHKVAAGAAVEHGQTHAAPDPTLEDVQRVLDGRVAFPARASEPTWFANFCVNSRMATAYRSGPVFLAGDAAHIHSPAGGQGMNTGLQDAFNLAWKLALVEHGVARPTLLDTYHAERYAVGVELLKNTDRMAGMALLRHPVAAAVRNAVVRTMLQFEVMQQRVRQTVSELAVGYRTGPLAAEHHGGFLGGLTAHGPHAGDRAPDVPLGGGRLFDLLRDPKAFTLLAFAGRDGDAGKAAELADRVRGRWGKAVRTAVVGGEYADPDRLAHDRYGARSPALYLLRPDGYVGFRSLSADEAKLDDYLHTWLKA